MENLLYTGRCQDLRCPAGYESATTLFATMLAGANYIWHSAGWNEAGMHCSVAKFMVDAEQVAMAYRMAQGPKWNDFDEALKAVEDIGPGGHYLGHDHTQKKFQSAFFMPEMFDNNSIEQWVAEGSQEITQRALARARKLLDAYQMPEMDKSMDEALLEYIRKRETEIPAASELNQEY